MTEKGFEKLRSRAAKTGIRTAKKRHHVLSKDEVLAMRVQILPALPRVIMFGLGIILILSGFFEWITGTSWVCGIQAVMGIFLMLFGIFGIHRTIDELGNQLSYEAFEVLLETIFEGIGSIN